MKEAQMAAAPLMATAANHEPGDRPPAPDTGAAGQVLRSAAHLAPNQGQRESEAAGTAEFGPSANDETAKSPEPGWHSYRGSPDQAAVVRAFLTAALADCPAAEDVVLMADELVSNAIQHSKSGEPNGTFRLRLTVRPGTSVRVEVADAGGAWAGQTGEPRADEHNLRGRGLRIVGALAAMWGVHGNENSRTVWFTADWDQK
jgi:serine/threonine-protein kinase RsbW